MTDDELRQKLQAANRDLSVCATLLIQHLPVLEAFRLARRDRPAGRAPRIKSGAGAARAGRRGVEAMAPVYRAAQQFCAVAEKAHARLAELQKEEQARAQRAMEAMIAKPSAEDEADAALDARAERARMESLGVEDFEERGQDR